ncbi:M48 family metalloprotease [Niveispirillum irakense]|uniref:M48 family metalloprotease n=1 Tax=Niveispirillum irakense TaxID=34011 RepID=UPI000552BF07|nr:M48 family metalloprotease [Niveispirillum irakense]
MSLTRRRAARFAALPLIALLASACSTNPVTGDRQFTALMPPEQEAAIGAQQHPEMLKEFGGRYEDAKLQAYVDDLGQRLAAKTEIPGTRYTFTVLDSPIINAFALPGGYVYVSRGLMALANSEAELAGVVGHEIGHVTARHSADRYGRGVLAQGGSLLAGLLLGQQAAQLAQSGSQLALAGFGRGQELQADGLGIRYMTAAGYDPQEMSGFLSSMGRHSQLEALLAGKPGQADQFSYLQTHPPTGERAQQASSAAAQAGGIGLKVGRNEYLRAIDGMIYGDSPAHGYVRGRVFAHPGLNIRFEVPEGFRLLNGDTAVVGVGPQGAQIIFDQQPGQGAPTPQDYIARVWAANTSLGAIQSLTIDGQPAATVATRLNTNAGAMDARLVAIRAGANSFNRFLFVSPPALSGSLSAGFQTTATSFRKLTAAEQSALKPYRLRVVQVKAGEKVADFVKRMPYADYPEERFRVLNNIPPGAEVQAGQLIKIVTEG